MVGPIKSAQDMGPFIIGEVTEMVTNILRYDEDKLPKGRLRNTKLFTKISGTKSLNGKGSSTNTQLKQGRHNHEYIYTISLPTTLGNGSDATSSITVSWTSGGFFN